MKKNINRRARRDRRAFSSKRLKAEIIVCIFHPLCVFPDLCGLWFLSQLGDQNRSFSGSSAVEDKRMNEEEAESAEILF
jgi:hypothetical protein